MESLTFCQKVSSKHQLHVELCCWMKYSNDCSSENFHETAKETILRQWSDVGRCVFMCLGVYPSSTRIALKRIATCKGGCGSSKPLGIYRTPFQPCFGLPLPHCCLHRSILSCTVQECNVTTCVLSPSSWTFVFARNYARIIYANRTI